MAGPSDGVFLRRRSLLHLWFTSILALTSTGRGIALISANTYQRTGTFAGPRGGSTGTIPFGTGTGTAQHAVTDSTQESASLSNSDSDKKESSYLSAGQVIVGDPSENRGPLKVLFLSADTGGGHRASAESLAKQFLINFPGSTYDLLDVWGTDGVWPYRTLVGAYQHLSSHPNQWRALYHLSNSRPWEIAMDLHSNLICGRKIRKRIASYEPDLIVSVHPAMNNVPCRQVKILSKQADKHIPFFTVVTDLASGHCTWFQKNVDKLYLASDRLKRLAKRRGGTPDENIVMTGLPIRNDFGVEAGKLGDRTTAQGKEYQVAVRRELGLDPEKPMVMVMGGGEGVGSLAKIVDELYVSFSKQGVDATICVVCGRNEKLKKSLEERDWASVLAGEHKPKKRYFLFRVLRHRRSRKIQESLDRALAHAEGEGEESTARAGKVDVVGLGFVTRMAEYMVAATVLVSKAGPGTIAEAAAVGLPVMLTSFLPGQEAGNVDYVLDNDFGDFNKDPVVIAEEVACWLKDTDLMDTMSRKARAIGHPDAASDIVIDIGSITHTWKALNGDEVRGVLRLRPNDY